MKASTTIKQMMAGNKIFVPSYQRAYSWDTEFTANESQKQTNVFLSDLEHYNRSKATSPYYFGHFLFEERDNFLFGIIDGQQRLTTIVIFLSALFRKLESLRHLTELEEVAKEDMVLRKTTARFETVDYDKQLFKDYVITKTKKDKNGLETASAKRIVNAYDYFENQLESKDETYLVKMLDTIQNATCTTHPVSDESEAIQMFIFQNNRGKKPSNLEIIKAQFMFTIHLYGGDDKESLIEEIKARFEKIYKSISAIEYKIKEDDILVYSMRVHFNSLWEADPNTRINELLSDSNALVFIQNFTQALATTFEHLTSFFGKDERNNQDIHSLVTLGGIGIALPFIIKAYKFGLSIDDICKLCRSFESIVLRHRLIGTRADITSRLNDVYQKFDPDTTSIKQIIDRIEWMKTAAGDSWWWSYWNNKELEHAIQGNIHHATAKYVLWKYENYLESQGKGGYTQSRYDKIIAPELEHIAPQTENPQAGYDVYDAEFQNQYINCLGNYLLLSKSHNCSVGNKPFLEKRNSYTHSEQQREIQKMTTDKPVWNRSHIQNRKDKIVKFILTAF